MGLENYSFHVLCKFGSELEFFEGNRELMFDGFEDRDAQENEKGVAARMDFE